MAESTDQDLTIPGDDELDEEHVEIEAGRTIEQPGAEPGAEGLIDDGSDDDAVDIQFGDEAPPASEDQVGEGAAQWVKDLRKKNAELVRELRQHQAKEGVQQQPVAVPTLGEKPKLEAFDYDEAKFEEALSKWFADKARVEAAQTEQRTAAETRQRSIDERLNGYRTEASSLRRSDFQDVETQVVEALSVEQQGIILAGADKPASLIYALGRYPKKLHDLAQIKDPVRFAFAAAKLEKEIKVTARSANKPAPETRVSSSSGAPATGGGEKKLEQLRAQAEKTGDFTQVVAYKAQLKKAQKARH